MRSIFLAAASLLLFFSVTSCEKEIQTEIEKIVRDTIRITDTLDVDRPINLKVSKGAYNTKINISWTSMPLAKAYQVWRFNSDNQKYEFLKELTDTVFDDLAAGRTLTKTFYKVRTYNGPKSYSRFSDADFGYLSAVTYYRAYYFGSEGSGLTQFNFPMHVEVDKANNIYVSDEGANRVLKFDFTGKFVEQFYTGTGARAMAFLPNGNYIATRVQSNSYVQLFNANKQIIREWGTYGIGDSNFGNVEEIALDDEQNIWIVDGVNHRVKKYDQNGNLLLKFGKQGSANGDFDAPYGICYFKNKIYVSDTRNKRIQVFDKLGKYLKTWNVKDAYFAIKTDNENLFIITSDYLIRTDENGDVQEKIGVGQFSFGTGVAIAKTGEVITCDVYARRISIYKKG